LIIVGDIGQAKSIVKILNLREVNFQLFQELAGGSPWITACKVKGGDKN